MTITINEIPLDPTDNTKTQWGSALSAQYYFVIANGTAAAEIFDFASASITPAMRALMIQYNRGIVVNMGAGDDTVIGSDYADIIDAGSGNNRIDGGANGGSLPHGGKPRDVLNVFVDSAAAGAALKAVEIAASATGPDGEAYAAGYRFKIVNGTDTNYVKNVEQVNVFLSTDNSYVKTIRLALDVHEVAADSKPAEFMHLAWVQGTSFNDNFSMADVSAATQTLMATHGRGVWIDTGAGNDTAQGSGYGDDFTMGAGTNYVDGGANAGSPPWGGKAQDVLHVLVASQAAADAVQVTQLASGMSGADAQALADGYTHKVVAGGETDYIKGIERITVQVANPDGGSSWVRDIPLAVVVHEADLTNTSSNYYHLAWVNGTQGVDVIDLSGDTALLSAALKTAIGARGRGVWVDGGAGNDTITGTGYADNFRNGAGNAKVDGGANIGGKDVFEISVASQAEMDAVRVVASDDPAYDWMVTYGDGKTEKDYLKSIEAISVNVTGTSTGKWIPLAVQVHEIGAGQNAATQMHHAWVQGTEHADRFSASTDLSAATKALMDQHGRGVWVDMGAGDDRAQGSGYGDDFSMGAGTNHVDGGANAGSPPWGGQAQDVLRVTVASQADADAVQVTQLAAGMSGADDQAITDGYTHKVVAGNETDYLKGIERVTVQIATGNGGSTWARDIPLAVVVREADLAAPNLASHYHLAWVNGTAGGDSIDAGAASTLLSAPLKAAMASHGRGVWIDGGAGADTIVGSAYADNIRNGAGNAKIDGGANIGGQDVFEISVGSAAEMDAIRIEASDDNAYTWMVTYGAGNTQKDYLKNVEAISVHVSGTSTGKWIPLALRVQEIASGTQNLDQHMHFAWAQGTEGAERFDAASDLSAATRALMAQHGRGIYADMEGGNDTVTGSAYGDDIDAGAGINYVDGGANTGTAPWGGKAQDVLRVTVASQAAADAVQVTALAAGGTAEDAAALAAGYTHKVSAGAETDYIKGIERVSIQIATGDGGSSFARDIPLTVTVQEANLADSNVGNYSHLAWVNGTAGADSIDMGAAGMLSSPLTAAMASRGRGVWIDGGDGNDTIVGTGYGDFIRNGAGNSRVDGGANTGPDGKKASDVFQIEVASVAAMNAVKVVASDNPDYTWMVTYGADSSQKDYLKNIEAVSIHVPGAGTGRHIPLALEVHEIAAGTSTANYMHLAWATGTAGDDSFNAATDVSAPTRALMDTAGRGVFVDTGAGNDRIVTSAYGDNIVAGAGVNYIDGGANQGTSPGGGNAADVIQMYVADQAAADAVAVTKLSASSTGADADAFALGYQYKVANGTIEVDYVKNVEQVHVLVWNDKDGDGFQDGGPQGDPANEISFARSIQLGEQPQQPDRSNSAPTFAGAPAGVAIDAVGDSYSTTGGTVLAGGKLLSFHVLYTNDGTPSRGVLARHNADGSVDTSYGGGSGRVEIAGLRSFSNAAPVELADGKVLVAATTTGQPYDMRVLRLNADGSPDTTFGNGGQAVINVSAGNDQPVKLMVQPDGKIVVAGWTAAGATGDMAVTRLNANGSLDTGFNQTGFATLSIAAGNDTVAGATLQPDGKIVLVGYATGSARLDVAVARFNADGTLDTGFGTGGQVMLPVSPGTDTARDVIVLPDGKLLLAGTMRTGDGSGDVDGLLVRLNANGSLDASFGSGGMVKARLSEGNDLYNRIQVQADGKIVVLGSVGEPLTSSTGGDLALTRYHQDGSPDTAFGINGTARIPSNGAGVNAVGLALADGKIVVFATAYISMQYDANSLIARLDADGRLDPTFNPAPVSTLDGGLVRADGLRPQVLDSNVAVYDAELAARGNYGGARITLERQGGASADDLFSGSGEVLISDGALRVGGITIGSVSQAGGTLAITFNNLASQGLVNRALHGIAYANASATPPDTVTIDWRFSDGNDGSQGIGGALGALASTQVRIGVLVREVAERQPGVSTSGQPMADLDFLAQVNGSARSEAFDATTGFSTATQGLMQQYQRGATFVMGPGNDTVTGTAYSDDFTMGSGVNRIDGGANDGAHPYANGAGFDRLNVYVTSDAQAAAVKVTRLDAGATGEDAAAFTAGYDVKVVNGSETDYVKNVESIVIFKLNDANGNGQQDAGETMHWVREIPVKLRVDEIDPDAALSDIMHFAWANGWDQDDRFDANVDVSAATRARMDTYQRGVYADTGAGNDTIVGSAYGDNFTAGAGTNWIDGGAQAGNMPQGGRARDALDIYVADAAAGAQVKAVTLTAGMSGDDALAYDKGYAYKIVAGAEIDYVKNIETVNIFAWKDANGNGQREHNGEVQYLRRIPLALQVDEVVVSSTNPGQDSGGNPLSNHSHFAWAYGAQGDDSFSVASDVSAKTQGLISQYGRGVYVDVGAGNDSVVGSAFGDFFMLGTGTNKLDGGANLGVNNGGRPAEDVLDVFVADQAAADALQITELSAAMSGADAQAFIEGYRFKIANGSVSTDYVKNIERVNIQIWNDKNSDGQRDYRGNDDPANEVTWVRSETLGMNTAPSFAGAPAGVAVIDAGYDLTPIGFATAASGKAVTVALIDSVDAGSNYVAALLRTNADGSLDSSFGNGGRVMLPTFFGSIGAPVLQGDKILVPFSTSLAASSDLKLVRYNADGSVDTGFGVNGEAVVSLGDRQETPRDLLVQADGKIVLAGAIGIGSTDNDFGIVRLNADGSLDTGFNGSGKLVVPFGAGFDTPNTMLVQSDGKLLLAGTAPGQAGTDLALLRVNQDGSLDAGFGNGGKTVLPIGPGADTVSAVSLLAGGKILLAGSSRSGAESTSDYDVSLVRLNADGTLDTSFGTGGKTLVHTTGFDDRGAHMLVLDDGKIIVAGSSDGKGGLGGDITLLRFNANGTLDAGFGASGVAALPLRGIGDIVNGIELVGGKLVVLGTAHFNLAGDASMVLARFNLDGSLDTGFHASQVNSLGGTVRSDGLRPVVLDANAAIYDAEMSARDDYSGATLTLTRQGGANAQDVFSAMGEVSFANGQITVAGIQLGWVQHGSGTLTLGFNYPAPQDLVNRALHGIGYANTSAAPQSSVTIEWSFSDRNGGQQGRGGALETVGTTTVEIGLVTTEVVRAYANPAMSTENRLLANVDYFASVNGSAHGETFAPTGFSAAARALMDEFQRGARFQMGGGDDRATGTVYSDEFTMGTGTDHIDGGANTGNLFGGPGRDTLRVLVADQAQADAVRVLALDGSAADVAAATAGYSAKVVDGANNVSYVRNIENLNIWQWQDANGDGVAQGGELQHLRGEWMSTYVGEVQLSATDPAQDSSGRPLANSMHFAWVNGWAGSESVNVATDVSAATRGLMDQYKRGVYADLRGGNDSFTGSAYGDHIEAGAGFNRIDGGTNTGLDPQGNAARDYMNVYAGSAVEAAAVRAVQLTASATGDDLAAFQAGYTFKLERGAEFDYLKGIESVGVSHWADDGDGIRENGEISFVKQIELAVHVGEQKASAADPTKSTDGQDLATMGNFAWINGTSFSENVLASDLLSTEVKALMAQFGGGVYLDARGGGDTIVGTAYADSFVLGKGVNYLDGGTSLGNSSRSAAGDILDIYVGSAAERDAVKFTVLTGTLSGDDAAAQAAGYQYKIVAAGETNYVKGIEHYNVHIWDDKDGDGQRDYTNDANTEVTHSQGMITLVGFPT
ncbi:hypothetical protein [Massilia sp. LjRoot122]|uniref:hypothetical protein n=1 Tax=Massilia sp. LjRoot122 TaxID=3342257 RepID=UPI003ED0E796